MRRIVASVAFTLSACAPGGGYPVPEEPPNTWAYAPVAVGDPGWTVVVYIQPRPGDRLELLGAEPIGITGGASVEFFVSRSVIAADGDLVLGERRETLVGSVIEGPPDADAAGPEFTVGIMAEVTPNQPGRYILENVRLRYRINDGGERFGEGIDTMLIVCADTPAPADCPEGDEQP